MKNDFSFLLFFVLIGIALTGKSYDAKKIRLIKHLKASIEKRRNLNKIKERAPKNVDNTGKNVLDSQKSKRVGSLNDSHIEFHLDENYLRINGILSPENLLSKNDVIPLQFIEHSKEDKIQKLISCTAIKVEDSKCTFECENKNQTINTSLIDYDSFESVDDNIYMKVHFNHEDENLEDNIDKFKINKCNRCDDDDEKGGLSTGGIVSISIFGGLFVIGIIVAAVQKCRY